MLLLTSVILLIGFIALSAMVIRVTQLPEETTQDARRPIDLEADAVAEGVRHLMLRMQENPDTDIDATGHTTYKTAVEASLGTLVDLEKGRGFRFEWVEDPLTGDAVTCSPGPDPDHDATVSVTIVLRDLDTRVQLTIEETFLGDVDDPVLCSP